MQALSAVPFGTPVHYRAKSNCWRNIGLVFEQTGNSG
jgi:hypothetical protein